MPEESEKQTHNKNSYAHQVNWRGLLGGRLTHHISSALDGMMLRAKPSVCSHIMLSRHGLSDELVSYVFC